MERITAPGIFTTQELQDINRCRLYLQVFFLSDIKDRSGHNIGDWVKQGHKQNININWEWPVQHVDAVFHIFAYLALHHNSRVMFDPTYPSVDMGAFIKTDWKSMYGDVKEMIPSDSPVPRGKEVDLRLFVDSDHAGEQFTRRSRTGYVIYLNMAPILWFSKRQPTVESIVFGADFVVMKNGIETCRGLRYKLRMMGVTLSGSTFVYGDNMSVSHNNQRPESVLKKKSNSLCYHMVRESAAMGDSIIGHVPSVDNPTDICTKVVAGGQKRNHLIRLILHDLYD
jgi:hypothetical protein